MILLDLGELLVNHRRIGRQLFDLFLVAQVSTHNVSRICTYNVNDFRGLPGIDVRPPDGWLT
jgi:hypothetical protein